MRISAAFLAVPLAAASASAAFAGSEQAFDNYEPSLALTLVTPAFGAFPDGTATRAQGATLGFVYDFAGDFAPADTLAAAGQPLSFSTNTALGSVFGVTYGGDFPDFKLPNLAGRAIVGAGGGLELGAAIGSASVTLTPSQAPAPGEFSAAQPYDTVQPSLALTPLIAVNGDFPAPPGSSGTSAFIGQIANYAGAVISSGSAVPGGWLPAGGQLLPINSFPALFAVIGTTYGGNGTTSFALPNLAGRIAIGADAANPLGSVKGSDGVLVNRSELPGPGQQPLSDDQPSLAVNYLIATTGIIPSATAPSLDQTAETLGQIVEFAGKSVPAGWALANGQLLPISEDPDLFALIGATYGGDGVSDFALPDLNGRTVIGASLPVAPLFAKAALTVEAGGDDPVGDALGADAVFLTSAELPAPVPEPSTWTLMMLGLVAVGFVSRRIPLAGAAVRSRSGG